MIDTFVNISSFVKKEQIVLNIVKTCFIIYFSIITFVNKIYYKLNIALEIKSSFFDP